MSPRPKVTVYVPSHNYGQYLRQAVDSVLHQSLTDWEMILIDDASSDDTLRLYQEYVAAHPDRISLIHHDEAKGLTYNANRALEQARGRYIMRLDADDWLDESALLVLSNYLDQHEDVALVYPNYFYVDADGGYLGVEHRKKVGTEAKLLDLPAHGACTMVRKRVLKVVGGYDEKLGRQDGWDLWIKVMHRYGIANVSTPLFYYRQHASSLSRNEERLLSARSQIKRTFVAKSQDGADASVKPRVLAVVPAKNTYARVRDVVLQEVAGKPLLDHTVEAALEAGCTDVVVTTDDQRVVDYVAERFPSVLTVLRPEELSASDRRVSEVVMDAVRRVEAEHDVHADIVALLSVHSPLRTHRDVETAINSLMIFEADSVSSVYEDHDLHLVHGERGLVPLNPAMERRLRLEREGLYVDNGAMTVSWRDVIAEGTRLVGRVSHIVMPRDRSYQIKSEHDRWIVSQILEERGS